MAGIEERDANARRHVRRRIVFHRPRMPQHRGDVLPEARVAQGDLDSRRLAAEAITQGPDRARRLLDVLGWDGSAMLAIAPVDEE